MFLAKNWTLRFCQSEKKFFGKIETVLELPSLIMSYFSGPILSMDMSPTGDMCYTGGFDGVICCWSVPSVNSEIYDPYGRYWIDICLVAYSNLFILYVTQRIERVISSACSHEQALDNSVIGSLVACIDDYCYQRILASANCHYLQIQGFY